MSKMKTMITLALVALGITAFAPIAQAENVAKIGDTYYATLAEAVAAAETGDTVEIIKAGSYPLPKSIANNIAITGAVENVKIDAIGTGNISSIQNGATFKNLAFILGNATYHGFYHAGLITMEDCELKGLIFSYGSMTFKNSAFTQGTEEYCMWVYGGDEVTYDGCTFDVQGKCLNVFREGDNLVKLNVTNCTFNSTVLNKSAINFKETSTSGEKVTVLNTDGILSDCTIGTPDFFPTDKVGGSRLYMIDDLIPASEHKNTGLMITCDGKPVWPLPIEAKPVAVANATAEVYTNGYLSAKVSAHGWAAWSNQTATVVYTAAKGYLFADGSTVATNKLDTAVDPAVNAKGEVVPVAGKPAIELGVIAQRYPWDGKVDAHYRAKNWPKEGTFGAVEIKVGDTVVTNALNIFKSGEGVQVIDMKLLFGEKAEKAQFKAIVSNKPTGFAEVKKLPEGAFPKEIVDEAYELKAMDTVEGSVSPYASWDADLYISFDRDIAEDTVKVAGQWGVFPWVPFELPAMKAGEEIAFRKDVTPYEKSASWNYCCKTIQTISSGVKNLSADNTGAKMKVVLRLTSNEDPTKTIDITTIKTTLAQPAE